jgi:hypothetical protein
MFRAAGEVFLFWWRACAAGPWQLPAPREFSHRQIEAWIDDDEAKRRLQASE